jgi:ribonuclease P protein component
VIHKSALISNSKEILRVFNSKKREGHYVNIFYRPSLSSRVCVIVSKKVSKSSVKRNYMKRFIKSFFIMDFLYNTDRRDFFDIIILVKKPFCKTNKGEVYQELKRLCKDL